MKHAPPISRGSPSLNVARKIIRVFVQPFESQGLSVKLADCGFVPRFYSGSCVCGYNYKQSAVLWNESWWLTNTGCGWRCVYRSLSVYKVRVDFFCKQYMTTSIFNVYLASTSINVADGDETTHLFIIIITMIKSGVAYITLLSLIIIINSAWCFVAIWWQKDSI